MTNRKRGLCKIACTLSQGDPSLGKVSTADFQTSCKAVSITIARSKPAASLVGKFLFVLIQLSLNHSMGFEQHPLLFGWINPRGSFREDVLPLGSDVV